MESMVKDSRIGIGPPGTKFWIGKSDGLFHKEASNGEERVKTSKIYEYDPSIKIEAPIP